MIDLPLHEAARSFFDRSLARSPACSLPTYIANHKRSSPSSGKVRRPVRSLALRFPLSPRISPHELLGAWRLTRPTCLHLSLYLPIKESIAFPIVMSVRGKQVQNGTYEFDYMRVPDTRTRWEIFRDGIYNSQKGTYCGHPPKKWGKFRFEYFVYSKVDIQTAEDESATRYTKRNLKIRLVITRNDMIC